MDRLPCVPRFSAGFYVITSPELQHAEWAGEGREQQESRGSVLLFVGGFAHDRFFFRGLRPRTPFGSGELADPGRDPEALSSRRTSSLRCMADDLKVDTLPTRAFQRRMNFGNAVSREHRTSAQVDEHFRETRMIRVGQLTGISCSPADGEVIGWIAVEEGFRPVVGVNHFAEIPPFHLHSAEALCHAGEVLHRADPL